MLGRCSAGTLRLSIDDVGLRYEIDPPDTQSGRDCVTSIERGDMTGSSFGFNVTSQAWRDESVDDEQYSIREITGVELFDVSPVTYPAYEGTSTGVARSAVRDPRRRAGAAPRRSRLG